jgi:uncharacterized protein with von Willebrand factor type A (vWA) domain
MFDANMWEKKKKIIAKKKEQVSRDQGKYESLAERLQNEFGCTFDEAEAKKKELMDKKAKQEAQLNKLEEELEQYDWDV